jgi:hypothetical protein
MKTRLLLFAVLAVSLIFLALPASGKTTSHVSDKSSAAQLQSISSGSGNRSILRPTTIQNAAPTASQNIEVVGQIGDVTRDVVVRGNYAYAGFGPRLTILNISNPYALSVVGQTPILPGVVNDIAIAGNYAYVTTKNNSGRGGLCVIDVSNPSAPVEVWFNAGLISPMGIAMAGHYAYVVDSAGALDIFDITVPSAPTYTGWLKIGGDPSGIAVVGNYAYVTNSTYDDSTSGLYIVNVSNPVAPVQAGFYDTSGPALDVAVSGNYAYVVESARNGVANSGGLRVINVANPIAPNEVGFYYSGRNISVGGIAVSGSYAYVAFSGLLNVINISNPSSLNLAGSLDSAGYSVFLAGNYAYLANDLKGINIVNITNPAHPTLSGAYNTPGDFGHTTGVAVMGNYAYVIDWDDGLRVINVMTPTSPTEVGFNRTRSLMGDIAVAGNYAYVTQYGIATFKIDNPTNIRSPSYSTLPSLSSMGLAISGTYLYVADYDAGLRILRIGSSGYPAEVGFYDTPGLAYGVAVMGNYAYVADRSAGLQIINVSNPVTPTEVGFYSPLGDDIYDVAVAGNYAYVVYGDRLHIIDISNPTAPTEVGSCDTWAGGGVVIDGNLVYVYGSALSIIDVSNPAVPKLVGFRDTLGYAEDLAVANGYIYVADLEAGLSIFRYTGGNSIAGRVADVSNNPIAGVTISAGSNHNATTDASGYYAITNLINGTYALTPTKSGYVFAPISRTITLPPGISGQDFTAFPDVSISHIEVTQVTQDITNSVPLISDKPTFVRVYVDCTGCTSPELTGPNVTGILRGYGPNGELSGSPRMPVNSSITTYGQNWTNQRGDLKKTLNFSIPSSWANGNITLTTQLVGTQISKTITATFEQAKSVSVIYIPIRYKNQEPELARMRVAHAWAADVYPTARVNYLPGTTIEWNKCMNVGDSGCSKEQAIQNWVELINVLATQYPSLMNVYIFGWLPHGTVCNEKICGGLGIGRAAFGDDDPVDGRRLFAHEIGHLLGRQHTNTIANLSDPNCWTKTNPPEAFVDSNSDWLTKGHFTTSKIQDYGLEGDGFGWLVSSASALKDPTTVYDYMSYCGTIPSGKVWTSPWTYTHLFSEMLKFESGQYSQSPTVSNTFFVASGLVFTNNTATLDPIWIISSTISPDNPPIGSEYCLEAQNSSGTALASRCLDLSFQDYESGEDIGVDGFHLMLPYPAGVTRIVMKKNSQELVTRPVSHNSPYVTVISPNGGEAWNPSETYTVTWTASDTDGDRLAYRVFYSSDGTNWIPVGAPFTQTLMILNAAELPGGTGGKIKVVASDGVNNGEDESDGVFTVAKKSPQPFILSPEGDGTIPVGAPLLLQGYAYDPEDGILGDSALSWTSSQDGNLGTGSNLLISLSQSKHTITLSATDSNGNTSTTSIKVNVGYRVYLPTVQKNH